MCKKAADSLHNKYCDGLGVSSSRPKDYTTNKNFILNKKFKTVPIYSTLLPFLGRFYVFILKLTAVLNNSSYSTQYTSLYFLKFAS